MNKPNDAAEPSLASAGYGYSGWVLDASFWPNRVFVPLGKDALPILGMNLMAPLPPGKLVGVIHAGGQDAVDEFVGEHADELEEMLGQLP
jgi:hypothetical protein